MAVQTAKELTVYKKAYALAMRAFQLSKRFPAEERFALTGQLRRSSRSVCNNLRQYRIPYSLTTLHTVAPSNPLFKWDLANFVATCRDLRGAIDGSGE